MSAKKEDQERIALRVPGSLVRRAEQQAKRLSEETGLEVGPNDVIRAVLLKHLDPLADDPAKKSAPKR